jgi:hypothetical protein
MNETKEMGNPELPRVPNYMAGTYVCGVFLIISIFATVYMNPLSSWWNSMPELVAGMVFLYLTILNGLKFAGVLPSHIRVITVECQSCGTVQQIVEEDDEEESEEEPEPKPDLRRMRYIQELQALQRQAVEKNRTLNIPGLVPLNLGNETLENPLNYLYFTKFYNFVNALLEMKTTDKKFWLENDVTEDDFNDFMKILVMAKIVTPKGDIITFDRIRINQALNQKLGFDLEKSFRVQSTLAD